MRICLVLETGGGGAGRHVLDLARELAEREHHVSLIYSQVRAEKRFLDELAGLRVNVVPVNMMRVPGLHDAAAARALSGALASHGPFDILHGHSAKAGALARLVPARGAARVYTPHAFRAMDGNAHPLAHHAVIQAERLLGAARTDALIAVSQGELAFAARHGIANGRRHLIRNGVIRPRAADRAGVRHKLRLSQDDLVIGFVGRLAYQKAPERFVSVMARVMRERPHARAVIIGDGELRGEIAAAVAHSGMPDRFIQLHAADAQDYIAAFDLLLLTSRYEGLSYVMLESLAAGVPIVSTDVAGAADVIEDGREGLIVRGEDIVGSMVEAVLRLAENRQLLRRMAQAATARSLCLNGMRMIDETEALYRRLERQKGKA